MVRTHPAALMGFSSRNEIMVRAHPAALMGFSSKNKKTMVRTPPAALIGFSSRNKKNNGKDSSSCSDGILLEE